MRTKLIEELFKEIHGPRNGSEEEIADYPSKEYITGVIIPRSCRRQKENPDSETAVLLGGNSPSDDDESGEEFQATLPSDLDPQIRPKAFGMSFIFSGEDPVFKICVTWGRYHRQTGSNDKLWKRKPFRSIRTIRMDSESKRISLTDSGDSGVELYVRKVRQTNEGYTIIISVVNDSTVKPGECYESSISEFSIFQPSVRIILEGEHELSEKVQSETYEDDLSFLYRTKTTRARGHMCSAVWKEIDYPDHLDQSVLWPDGSYFEDCWIFARPDFRTEFVPLYHIAAPDFDWHHDEYGRPPVLSAERLSEMWKTDEIDESLLPLTEAYESWVTRSEAEMSEFTGEGEQISRKIIRLQREALERVKSGIETLKEDENSRVAFCFANRTIWLQHKWKNRNEHNRAPFMWRPFQLAFFLMNIEPVCNRSSKHRNEVDLLWIPTGGGKTEAYQAIMAFTMAFRRRTARNGGDNITGGGTAVITRYTLRLLTIQQFRRMLGMVTAAEYLRVMSHEGKIGWRPSNCTVDDDWLYGSLRFSVGMWVGKGVTPNHLRERKKGAIDALLGVGEEGEPAQIITCPVCGAWLAVPNKGLPAGQNRLHLVVKADEELPKMVDLGLPAIRSTISMISDVRITSESLPEGYITLTLVLDSDRELDGKEIDKAVKKLEEFISFGLVPFRASRPGYFGCGNEPGRRSDTPADFEIYCPDPACPLNTDVTYREGVPFTPYKGQLLQDGMVIKKAEMPFSEGTRIPIPALTIDEQIYHRCPTIVVSTADKIARLAFEPHAAAMFGNVDSYNAYYGYCRNNLFPAYATERAKECTKKVDSFRPPDLIIQDELHLIEGPLGSMFGLYEVVVEALIRSSGERLGLNERPKYIASTATVKNAEVQVTNLFARRLNQFPPHGLHIDDNFFVSYHKASDGWNEQLPGRVYMGICTPGMGMLTSVTRLWSRLLKTRGDNRENPDVRYFWTVVGYFNALRELGGGRALYREDIIERLKYISSRSALDPENVYELSSRTSSTDIPQMLSELEACEYSGINRHPDAVFTTSMFGTGVDVPHLSLMIVNGQPKTTSQYIQATGRVGRKHGGLVLTFYRAGRTRDLNHYEMFLAYHHRMYLHIEPSSVSPFSDGVLTRASGPAIVSFLRNKPDPRVKWYAKGGEIILQNESRVDINELEGYLSERLDSITGGLGITRSEKVMREFKRKIDRWATLARDVERGSLVFVEYPFGSISKNVVLGDPSHKCDPVLKVVYDNAPQSLREVEETTGFEV